MNKKVIRIISLLFFLAILVGLGLAYHFYRIYLSPNVPKPLQEEFVKIPSNAGFQQVVDSLFRNRQVIDTISFRKVSERLQYKRPEMRPGRFRIRPGWSNLKLVRHLRGGEQATVDLVLNNERLIENVAAKAAQFIEPDSLELLRLLTDASYLQEIGYRPETLMSLFIPNTYDFYWNTQPKAFVERMQKEQQRFWEKDNRKEKAAALNMSPAEVYTLASIVEKETNQNSEKRRMAGVYLNRLRIGMPLQADPTAVFATRDFDTKRVTDYHLQFDSPYNTYLYPGLPPGPISMASITSIDAVLNAEKHEYLYFCAVGDGSGLHAFAKTLSGHNQNVRRYIRNLKKEGCDNSQPYRFYITNVENS